MHELARCVLMLPAGAWTGYVDAGDDTGLRLRFDDGAPVADRGTQIELHVLDDVRGEVRYAGTVARVDPFEPVVDVVELVRLGTRQRRSAARARTDVRIVVAVADPESGGVVEHRARVLDISATGARLTCVVDVPVGATMVFDFPTHERLLTLTGEVVWRQDTLSGWRFGVRLLATPPKDTEELFRFVLLTQGEQRRAAVDKADQA